MRSFPTSYPYSNSVGLELNEQDVEALAETFLNPHKPKTLEFGLELSYIILWGMSKAKDFNHLISIVGWLFNRAVKRSPRKKDETDDLLHRIIDPSSIDREDRILEALDVQKAVGGLEGVDRMIKLRSRDRLKKIYQLKQLWEA
jgi:hypothetical protein